MSDEMKKVYMVTSGEYSYRVRGIFSAEVGYAS